jgi:hypothetical protein
VFKWFDLEDTDEYSKAETQLPITRFGSWRLGLLAGKRASLDELPIEALLIPSLRNFRAAKCTSDAEVHS